MVQLKGFYGINPKPQDKWFEYSGKIYKTKDEAREELLDARRKGYIVAVFNV